MKNAAETSRSFMGLGAWMDHVPLRTQKPNTPDPALVAPLKALMAIPRADIITARRARLASVQPAVTPRSAPTL